MAEAQAQCPRTTVLQEVTTQLMPTAITLSLAAMLHPPRALLLTACKPAMS